MADIERSVPPVLSSTPDHRELQLFSLISQMCPPRQSREDSDACRLIFDGRLQWAVEAIDGGNSWFYLARPARARRIAGCLVLTQD